MFRFRLGSIPVEVQPSHLFTAALIGLFYAESSRSKAALVVVSWVVIIFVSVLVHELGHALASRAFGYQPTITLAGLGGHTHPNAPGPIPWKRDLLLTLAGPLFGLLLGLACLVADSALERPPQVLGYLLKQGAQANFFWAAFNLVPMLPLDGGHISTVLAMRLSRERGFLWAQMLGVLTSAALAAVSYALGQTFLVIFFVIFGVQALRAVYEVMKGPEQVGLAQAPLVQALRQAEEARLKNQLPEARRLASSVLDAGEALTPKLASLAHRVLGWVALKEGQGRAALDHFSQVQGHRVEAHALAAAFSLIGDETRALPLWEIAWRETGDRTVMHEYAGSLIRAGRQAQALRLPEVDVAAAFSCAERTLFIRGAYSEAAALGETALAHVPSPSVAYDAACAYARAHNPHDAVRLLHRARELGFRDAAYAASDEDLAALHRYPPFEAWLADLRQSAPS